MPLMRGAKPSARHRLAAAMPHVIAGDTPSQLLYNPATLSMWGNDIFGDCVSAEEAFAKACHNPEILIPSHKIIKWARNNFVLNGASLWEVLHLMVTEGIDHDDSTYLDGAFSSVDWTDPTILRNAIAQGPVKIGVAADQIENAYQEHNGWIATGFKQDLNLDHCVSLCGYGTFGWLASQLQVKMAIGDLAWQGYALFTWSTIGIIDYPSLLAITGEAWLRKPTTVIRTDQ